MANYTIPLSWVVSATAVAASRGLQPLQLGTILILTDDEPVNALSDDYVISRTASSIGQDFGTESTAFKMANAIFAQNPNILNAGGYVIVAPYKASTVVEPATSGNVVTGDLSSNLAGLEAVTNGSLTISVDGSEAQVATGIDLSAATSLSDIALALSSQFSGLTITAVDNALVFTSSTTGVNSTVKITTSSSGTDLYGSSYLNIAAATVTDGTNAVLLQETTAQAIQRISEQIYFEGVLTTRDLSSSEATTASNLVESMDNTILFLTDTDVLTLENGGLFETLANNKKTRKLLYLTGANSTAMKANAKLFAAAFASRGLSVNYEGQNSTLTMTYKDLAGVPVDTNISENILNKCQTVGADVYCSVEGLAKVLSFKQGGLYFDELTNQIWLRTAVQRAVANVLFTTRTKIPQTTEGVNTLVNAITGVLNQGIINGMLAPGEWNSSDTFGILEDFHRCIRTYGYYVYYTPIAQQAQAEREQRKCPVISIAAKQSGAIEHANIMIYLEA